MPSCWRPASAEPLGLPVARREKGQLVGTQSFQIRPAQGFAPTRRLFSSLSFAQLLALGI